MRCPAWKGVRSGSFESIVSDRAWIGRGRRQTLGSGTPQRILTTRRLPLLGIPNDHRQQPADTIGDDFVVAPFAWSVVSAALR